MAPMTKSAMVVVTVLIPVLKESADAVLPAANASPQKKVQDHHQTIVKVHRAKTDSLALLEILVISMVTVRLVQGYVDFP